MDIAIVGDISRSMKTFHRHKLLRHIDRLIDELGVSPKGSHYGFITFDREAKVHNNFADPLYHNEENLKRKIREQIIYVPIKLGSSCRPCFKSDSNAIVYLSRRRQSGCQESHDCVH